ncbi:MAG: MBOAT family protein [Clostridia bacterium]|nr:MBOAT family protein [Clostridia bacterium]
MVFSSLIFLFLFLPACLILYLIPGGIRYKNAVLILFSLFFYAWGEPIYLFLMIAMALVNWCFGMLLGRKRRRLLLVLAVIFDLGCLAVFKYTGFLVENLNAVCRLNIPVPQIALPIGISFYTFQALTYTIDVWRGEVPVQKSFWRFLLYVSLFPQLIAGPIVRYADVEQQLTERSSTPEDLFCGMKRFCLGLAKKVLLADYCGKVASQILDGSLAASTTLMVWLGVLLFMFEIYFDFSGYSDMAIGLGRLFGFKYMENFDLPYCAKSISEFWRKWHISLSSFFRDYVYIPLGGNRRHVYLTLAIVWALTGLWHGASWNFVLWGVYFFVLLTIERLFSKIVIKIPNVFRHILTLMLLLIGWNIFYHTDFARLTESFRVMFGAAGIGFSNEMTKITFVNNLPLMILCAVCCTPIPRYLELLLAACFAEKSESGIRHKIYVGLVFSFCLLLLILSTASLVGSSYNAFLYFRF